MDQEALLRADRKACTESLWEFHRAAWPIIDPAPFTDNWHLGAICCHLTAVAYGQIRRLVINVPPRTSKSSLCCISFPAWLWAQKRDKALPLLGPQVQFLFASYAQTLSERDSLKMHRLVTSPWYQARWPAVRLAPDKDTVRKFETSSGGYRLATSVGGALTGEGGDIILIDDPLNAKESNYQAIRDAANTWWDESMSTRLNDPNTGAKIVIMQRLHEEDLTGHILEKDGGEWTALILPMRYEGARHCVTYLDGDEEPFWEDPRKSEDEDNPDANDGELLWPERFTEGTVQQLESDLGPFAAAGQLQQSPVVRGGSLIRSEWWRLWEGDSYPEFGVVIGSLDTAIKEKERNDYSALTIWGTFLTPDERKPAIMLRHAWRGRCDLATLVATVAKDCQRFGVDILLIEDKTRGTDVQNEIWRLYGKRKWQTLLWPVKGDKVARTIAVQHLWSGDMRVDPTTGVETFAGGMIWAPDRDWAQMVIDEMASFPLGAHDDLHDSAVQAINYLRQYGITQRREEYDDEQIEAMTYRKPVRLPYDI